MKKFSIVFYILSIIVFLIAANVYWKERTTFSSASTAASTAPSDSTNNSQSVDDLTRKWPSAAREAFSQTREAGVPYKITIAGSSALGAETNGWSTAVKKELDDTFGQAVKVDIKEFDGTSLDFMESDVHEAIIQSAPDLILYESFLLKDNGVVDMNTHSELITTFNKELKSANEQAVLMLQPPHPIYNATFYPAQKEDLKKFAQDNSLRFIDHWNAWPDVKDEKTTELLSEDQSTPNEKGHKIWADYLSKELIAE
ncbi:hypothetical protein F9802_06445 [Bacillus aerolatus]|uniref:SGNH/GDSL hydrolase family protein n=1 Tax=Bacillus aerolatus TaxID=2653354 RepID=A0A6I1FGK2_9BACI|nr:hypothetical protein [Bacillus aerolatus]KAB7707387.1 hypothetical protein F9802_06445 [Bacillus aerolatus]